MGTSIQDPKNRAFEAIARREVYELQLQQKHKHNKRSLEKNTVESSADFKCTNQEVPPSSSAENIPSKKGKYFFSGQTTTRDADGDHPIYLPLSHPVHENLAMPNHEVNVIDKILHELLQSGDSAQNYMQGSRRMKMDNRIHLDNKVQECKMSGIALAKALQSHSKRSTKHMSMKQHKKYGSLDLPQELHNFEIFKPMHEMWKGYIMQLLKSVGKSQMAQCLLGADLHGAVILVSHCKMAAFTGVSGIMIRETAETFGIITQANKFVVVLKKISVFMFQVDCWKITLHGDKLTSRKIGQ
ncbi:uncharacterized protein LOC112517402 [Cynara cardunculus var. scolymus]|nr:uncharacterized protein LOC112517402 [Cynara cardunculus var. scolymus]XP_024980589.1 uncharacterized protein LOC112517402 [Cynara cardunculus var. scolymus]XP_024980590.1 uncharacterized protein LOC112517402 [Cynara cardunculus var. scolymus]XP_024980591.1 uncharacterized protein LOC112517402 [Cynara cardunculus var. scolymus]